MRTTAHVGALALQAELWSGAVFQNVDGALYVAELDGPLSPFLRDAIQAHAEALLLLVQGSEAAAAKAIRRASSMRAPKGKYDGGTSLQPPGRGG